MSWGPGFFHARYAADGGSALHLSFLLFHTFRVICMTDSAAKVEEF